MLFDTLCPASGRFVDQGAVTNIAPSFRAIRNFIVHYIVPLFTSILPVRGAHSGNTCTGTVSADISSTAVSVVKTGTCHPVRVLDRSGTITLTHTCA